MEGIIDNMDKNYSTDKTFPGFVYIINYGDGSIFKIGFTILTPETRIKQIAHKDVILPMQLVMYSYVITNCRYLETLMHLHFEDQRVGGEWFRLDFPRLVEAYQILASFGSVTLCEDWYSLVPEDYKKFIEYGVVYPLLPRFIMKS